MSQNPSTIHYHYASGSVPPVQDPPAQVSVKFNDSSLRAFLPSAPDGKIAGGSGPPLDADVTAYQPYFDVDTSDVLERVKDSLFPFKATFNDKTADSPDLYGPFWICTTLIFVSASIGTLDTYIADKMQHKDWDYDVHVLTWSACVLYGYAVFVPITLYLVLKYLSAPLGLVQLICLYGYSLFIFIPAVCLSIIPVEAFRWMIVGVAGFMSAMFVASNLRSHMVSAGERWFWIVSGITLLQLALSILLKIYLFSVSI